MQAVSMSQQAGRQAGTLIIIIIISKVFVKLRDGSKIACLHHAYTTMPTPCLACDKGLYAWPTAKATDAHRDHTAARRWQQA